MARETSPLSRPLKQSLVSPAQPRRALSQARPQRVKQDEVEVKVERRLDFLYLNLSLNLNLLRAGGLFQYPASAAGAWLWPSARR
jgi:hypothetical protein